MSDGSGTSSSNYVPLSNGTTHSYTATAPATALAAIGGAPAVACTASIPATAANNGCYNVTSSASTAVPAASAFSLFTGTTATSQAWTLTSASFEYTVNCVGYISGSTLVLTQNQQITVKSDGTNIWATCTAATVYTLIKTSGSPFTMSAITGLYYNDSGAAYSWDLPTPVPGLQLCFGNWTGYTGYPISLIPGSGVTITFEGVAGTSGSSTGLVSGGGGGDFICLVGINNTNYFAVGSGYGTWTNH